MRPKKKIAIYCRDKERRSMLRMVLHVRGYKTVSAAALAGTPSVLWDDDLRCGLILRTAVNDGSLAFAAMCETLAIPVVFLDEAVIQIATAQATHSMLEVIECVKRSCARKRGPKRRERVA